MAWKVIDRATFQWNKILNLTKTMAANHVLNVDASQYRRLVGRLLYLQATWPDVCFSINVLSQFVAYPREAHLKATYRVFRYLKATPSQGILLPKDGRTNLVYYCDSDWFGCSFTRRSQTGYLLPFGGASVSWKSKKQSVMSRSSTEAELYRAMASTVSEILWIDAVVTTRASHWTVKLDSFILGQLVCTTHCK